jgi:hypothetical protein
MPGAPFLFFNETVTEHGRTTEPQATRRSLDETRRTPMMAQPATMKV